MTKAEPERFSDTKRNLILNRTVDNIHQSIHNHDPDINRPIDQEVWDCLDQMALEIEAQAHAAGVREGIEKATTPTDAMKAHFEGDKEIYQTFEIDGETHILPLRFATVRYVLDEIRALIKENK